METNYGYRRRRYVGEPKIKSINFFLFFLLCFAVANETTERATPIRFDRQSFCRWSEKVIVFASQQQLVSFNTHCQLSIRMRVSNH